MWLGYQQRQLADLTEQLRVLQRSPARAPVPVDPRLTVLEQKVAELERKPVPGPSPIRPPAPLPSLQPTSDPIPPPTPSSVEARLAKLEADAVRLKSMENQLSGQLTGLTQQQQTDAASCQGKIAKMQLEFQTQIDKIIKRLP